MQKVPSSHDTCEVRDYPVDFTRLLAMQWTDIDNTIRHADLKAQLILGIDALVLAGIISAPFLQMIEQFEQNSPHLLPVITGVRIAVLVFLVLSVFCALLAIFPRFKQTSSRVNVFYFGDAIQMSQAEYIDHFMSMSLDEVKAGVMGQIHAKSFIVRVKSARVRWSVMCLTVALLLWAGLYVIAS